MSAQARYTTLLKNTTTIYAAVADKRTTLLHKGLDEIVAGICPVVPADWVKVRADSGILLRIWATKENDPAAVEVLNQLMLFLDDQATEVPALLITDSQKDTIRHVKHYPSDDESEEDELPSQTKSVVVNRIPVLAPKHVEAEEEEVEIEIEVEVEKEEEEEAEEEEEEEEEVEEAEEEEEEEEEVEKEVEVEVEEEAEAEEEEADGMEVEQVTIRGRTYWIDTNSNKLYANAAGDEVGDEVGAMVNGKPVFLAPK